MFSRVAGQLRDEYGVREFGGLVWGRDQLDYLRGTGQDWWRIDVFSDWLQQLPDRPADLAYLESVERRYGLPNLGLIVSADRFLASWPYEKVMKILEVTFRRFEEMFEREPPDALIFESVDGLVTMSLYSVAVQHGVKCYLMADAARVGRATTYDNHLGHWREADGRFAEMRSRALTGDERADAETFRSSFGTPRVPLSAYVGLEASPKRSDLKRIVQSARRYARDPRNITLVSLAAMIRQRAIRMLRDRLSRGAFEAPVPNERYVLYPLHFQPEVSTLVWAPFAVDQPTLIEDIAKSLPIGYRLYVKEHFGSIGRRPLADYRRIRKVWNVRLIDPFADRMALIDGAAAVVTATSTMGWEAVVKERPVITVGEVFYNTFPLVVRAGAVARSEWPRLFRDAIRDHKPDRELLLRYVAALRSVTHPETISLDHPSMRPGTLAETNIRNITTIFARAMGLTAGGGASSVPRAAAVLRAAELRDEDRLLAWSNDPVTRRNSFDHQPIAPETHREWFRTKLHDPNMRIWIAEEDVPVGVVRYERRGDEVQVGIAVAPEHRGRGLGTQLLRLSAERASEELAAPRLIALILPENVASIRAFERAGYRHAGTADVRGQQAVRLVYER